MAFSQEEQKKFVVVFQKDRMQSILPPDPPIHNEKTGTTSFSENEGMCFIHIFDSRFTLFTIHG